MSPTHLKTDEFCFILVKNNVKSAYKIPENFNGDLTELNEHFMVEIPQDARVYQSCRHVIAILIVVMYADNNGLRTNTKELVQWFDYSFKKQGEIEMVPEGKFEWFLGVRYTYDHSTGSVQADQQSVIDRLLEKYGLTNCNPSKVSMRPDTDLPGLPISPLAEKTSFEIMTVLIHVGLVVSKTFDDGTRM